MARKPGSKASGEFALFDVFYEDGTQRSNRKVPQSALTTPGGTRPLGQSSQSRIRLLPRSLAGHRYQLRGHPAVWREDET